MSANTQLALVNNEALTKRDMFEAIDNVIVQLHQTGDLNKATNVINGLGEIEKVTGVVKAKLLWGMNEWNKITKAQEDFPDHILSTTSIQNRKTVLEYVNV